MPSPPRDVSPGLHHVWVNATGNWPYFLDDDDRMTWVRLLLRTLGKHDCGCVAFCQMTTHVHAILETRDFSLSEAMQYLNREYSRYFNDMHARYGQFVRKRFGSRRIVDGDDLLGTYAYVVLNPVVEGMCLRAEDWHWSSFATAIGLRDHFPFADASLVLAELAGSRARLREFVAAEAAARTAQNGHVRYQIPDVALLDRA